MKGTKLFAVDCATIKQASRHLSLAGGGFFIHWRCELDRHYLLDNEGSDNGIEAYTDVSFRRVEYAKGH